MSRASMKPEYDHGDYPPERFAWDARQALQDYMDVSNMPDIDRKTLERAIDVLNQQYLDDMAGFDPEVIPF